MLLLWYNRPIINFVLHKNKLYCTLKHKDFEKNISFPHKLLQITVTKKQLKILTCLANFTWTVT